MNELQVTITPTANGEEEYIQIMSADFTVNVVLIADKITVKDSRQGDND